MSFLTPYRLLSLTLIPLNAHYTIVIYGLGAWAGNGGLDVGGYAISLHFCRRIPLNDSLSKSDLRAWNGEVEKG
ncbi:MAG: hypothetical protein WA131_03855 [Desulfitobacteriaceae bacterium]